MVRCKQYSKVDRFHFGTIKACHWYCQYLGKELVQLFDLHLPGLLEVALHQGLLHLLAVPANCIVSNRVKPYRTPPSSNIQSSATQNFFCIISFYNIIFFPIGKFVILRAKYYPLLLHLQKCDTPKFEFYAETGCC